jgi:large subunit ribosomal protein L29
VKSKDKLKELRSQSGEQLSLSLKEGVKQIFTLRCQSAAERLEAPSEIRKTRREIARIKTILRQRELDAAKSQGADKK